MIRRFVIAMALVGACAGRGAPREPRYQLVGEPEELLDDAEQFGRLAFELRHDLEAEDAAGGGTPQQRHDRWFTLALLDGLEGRWAEATARLDQIVAAEPPSWMVGLTIRAWAEAPRHGGGREGFRAALTARIDAMPYAEVSDSLVELGQLGLGLTPEVARALVHEHVGPAAARGPIDRELAGVLVFQRWAVQRLAPVGAVIVDVVTATRAAHGDGPLPQ